MRGNTQQPDWLDYWYHEPWAKLTTDGNGYGGARLCIRLKQTVQKSILHWRRR